MNELKVFIGWDGREKIAYEVLKHSIEKHSKSNIKIIPLYHKKLREQGYFKRPWEVGASDGNYRDMIDGKPFSTEFSHTRFLIPELMNFNGWALFMDCDMLVRCDLKEVFEYADEKHAIMCVKHRQKVKPNEKKMDGSYQQLYNRKNWSSFMLFNCGHPLNKQITKEVVNAADGGWLHGFEWLPDECIGSLPDKYNWIDGSSRGDVWPHVIHYTLGGPWFDGYADVKFAEEWWKGYNQFMDAEPMPNAQLIGIDYNNL